jgi:hypothetical protein
MVMQSGMRISPSDWAKLTKEQKEKIYEFNRQCRAYSCTPASVVANKTTISETQSLPTLTPSTSPATTRPASTTCDICHLLSNSTSRESVPVSSYVEFNGRRYTFNFCSRTYHINNSICVNNGALVDTGANGGLSGSSCTF